MLEGKDENGQKAFYAQYDALPEPIRKFLLSPATVTGISDVTLSSQVPASFHIAISKIVALVAMGDVPITSIENLLTKLDLPPQQTTDVTRKLQVILEPVVAKRSQLSVPRMPELPPLTQKIPPIELKLDSSKPPGRNIIDLRKQQPEV